MADASTSSNNPAVAAAAAAPGSSEIAAALGVGAPNEPQGQEPAAPEPDPDGESADAPKNTLDTLPEWAQKEIRSLRREDRQYRQKASQYDDLVRTSMTEQQKAIEDAKQVGRSEAQQQYGERLAAAEIKAALTGIVDKPEDVIEDLNLARYVNDEGDVDADAVTALQTKWTALTGGKRPRQISHGRQANGSPAGASPKDQFADAVSPFFT